MIYTRRIDTGPKSAHHDSGAKLMTSHSTAVHVSSKRARTCPPHPLMDATYPWQRPRSHCSVGPCEAPTGTSLSPLRRRSTARRCRVTWHESYTSRRHPLKRRKHPYPSTAHGRYPLAMMDRGPAIIGQRVVLETLLILTIGYHFHHLSLCFCSC